MHLLQASAPVRPSLREVAECRAHKVRYHVGRDSDAEHVYRAEAEVDRTLPSGSMNLDDALDWITRIAHAEDVEPPGLFCSRLQGRTVAFACLTNHAIVVGSRKPTRLTILHEFVHLTTSVSHGREFQRELIRLTRKFLSIQHSLLLSRCLDP